MKLNTANKAFFALLALSVIAYTLLGAAACGLFSVVVYRLATDGLAALEGGLWGAVGLTVFVGTYVLGYLFLFRSLRNQIVATVLLRRKVRRLRLPVSTELRQAAERAGLDGRFDVIDADETFSFAYGVLAPRVAVSRGLVQGLSREELDAVLAHERYHLRNWDPVKVLVARALPSAFFYLPVLRELHKRYIAGRELAADRRAVVAHGERPLAGALYKVVRGPGWAELGAAAAIGGPELLDVRVSQLESGEEPALPRLRPLSWLLTGVGVAVVSGSFAAAVAALGWAGSMMGDRMMDDRSMSPIGVVFSLAFWVVIGVAAFRIYRDLARTR